MDESSEIRPSELENYSEKKAKNLELENHVINSLLSGEPATVYHGVLKPEDKAGIQESGIRGNYRIKVGEEVRSVAYFSLLFPTELDGRQVMVKLNGEGEEKSKIFDGRESV